MRLMASVLGFVLVLAAVGAQPLAAATPAGVVFTMSNSSSANRVLAWARGTDGRLTFAGSTQTGGQGTGGALNSQGALALSSSGLWLFAVNAGSDSVSVFKVSGTSLTLTDVESARGVQPISVTTYGSLVYVLNAGGKGNIRGFRRDTAGKLTFITGSGRPLSTSGVKPAQIGFAASGTQVVVTERVTDRLSRYRISSTGTADGPLTRRSVGAEPFGFDVAPNGTLVVSEAGNHVSDASSVSSYRFTSTGLTAVSGAVPTTETAACWVAITPDGQFAYVTNTPDNSISGFRLGSGGSLTSITAGGRTAATGAGSFPVDVDVSTDSNFLYVLTAGTDRIVAYAISGTGTLSLLSSITGLPGAATGLVVR